MEFLNGIAKNARIHRMTLANMFTVNLVGQHEGYVPGSSKGEPGRGHTVGSGSDTHQFSF